jgi:MoaA/NifB/PqqE/SkfB family radical SAM enzyme
MWSCLCSFFGRKPLRTVDFAPSYACNMNCEHCFAKCLEDPTKTPLTLAEYRSIADQAAALGAVHVAFQGGEPLLLKNLEQMIEALRPSRFIVSITTNGYLVTLDRLRELKRAGLDMLTVSIDSGIPAEHDSFRNCEQAHARATDAVMLAKKCGLGACVNTMVTHENIHSEGLRAIIDFCEQQAVKLNVILPAMAGKWRAAGDLALTESDLRCLEGLMAAHPFIRRDLDANYWRWGCGAVKEMLYINAYGDVLPCSFIHCSLGNVRNEPLRAIRERGLRVPEFQRYHHCCLPAEDSAFIQRRVAATFDKERLPIPFADMFPEHADEQPEPDR